MAKLRVHSFAMSLDGYGAGPRQSLDNPLGARGLALHEWAFNTRTFHAMHGKDGGSSGVDDDFVARGFDIDKTGDIKRLCRAASSQVLVALVLRSGRLTCHLRIPTSHLRKHI